MDNLYSFDVDTKHPDHPKGGEGDPRESGN